MDKLSVVIITRNEAQNLPRCLDSVGEVADELVVVDSGSTDATVTIAQERGAKVFLRNWNGFGTQKNYALDQATYPYVLSLDADEALSPELTQSILNEKTKGFQGAYSLNRITRYGNRWVRYCGWYPDRKVRLWKKNEGRWENEIHESVVLQPGVQIHHLKGDLLHYSFTGKQDLLDRTQKYAQLSARHAAENGKQANRLKLILNPAWRFLKDYFINLGFLEGRAGFEISRINAFGTYLKYFWLLKYQDKGYSE